MHFDMPDTANSRSSFCDIWHLSYGWPSFESLCVSENISIESIFNHWCWCYKDEDCRPQYTVQATLSHNITVSGLHCTVLLLSAPLLQTHSTQLLCNNAIYLSLCFKTPSYPLPPLCKWTLYNFSFILKLAPTLLYFWLFDEFFLSKRIAKSKN